MKNNNNFLLVGALAFLAVGCADPNLALEEMPSNGNKKANVEYVPSAKAGVQKDLAKTQDEKKLKNLIAATAKYGRRQNPFALSVSEIVFDKAQASERFLAEEGDMGNRFELPEDKAPAVVELEPQPYRRLSGVVIGQAIYALLEENGRTYIIRPGMMLPESNWKVVLIDKERAVITRTGDKLPKELEIRLESPPPGFNSGGGGRAGGEGNAPTGGPGGRPGGGGGRGSMGADGGA
jgi:hypothetical protein